MSEIFTVLCILLVKYIPLHKEKGKDKKFDFQCL